jgi:hypothetical protein
MEKIFGWPGENYYAWLNPWESKRTIEERKIIEKYGIGADAALILLRKKYDPQNPTWD